MTRILRAWNNAIAVNNDPFLEPYRSLLVILHLWDHLKSRGRPQNSNVDCADHARIGDELKERYPHVFLNVDHHVSNTKFAENNFVLSDASATGEISAKFFFDTGYEVDKTTAEGLYLGICTDTGQFCYSGTNAVVFEICRKLCEAGCNPAAVAMSFMRKKAR